MTLKKDLIRLLNKYSEDSQSTRVLMEAISSLGEPQKVIEKPIEKPIEGVTIGETVITILPTPTEDYPKGLVIECNGKKAEGDIKSGVSEYPLPPIIVKDMPARAYIKPRNREPMVIGTTDIGYGKQLAEAGGVKSENPGNYPGI